MRLSAGFELLLKTASALQKRRTPAKPGGPKAKTKKSVSAEDAAPATSSAKTPARRPDHVPLSPQDTEEEEEDDDDEDEDEDDDDDEQEKASSDADSSSDDDDDDDNDDDDVSLTEKLVFASLTRSRL